PGTKRKAAGGSMVLSDQARKSAADGGVPADTGGGPSGMEVGDADRLKKKARRFSTLRAWRNGIRATRTGAMTLKVVVGVIGTVMVVGGLIMVPFPGPGWLVVFAGLDRVAQTAGARRPPPGPGRHVRHRRRDRVAGAQAQPRHRRRRRGAQIPRLLKRGPPSRRERVVRPSRPSRSPARSLGRAAA